MFFFFFFKKQQCICFQQLVLKKMHRFRKIFSGGIIPSQTPNKKYFNAVDSPVVDTGSNSSGGFASFFGAESCSSRLFSFSLSFSKFPGFRSLMSRERFLHRTSISNLRLSCGKRFSGLEKGKCDAGFAFKVNMKSWMISGQLRQERLMRHLEIVLLMQLCKNIHNGHGPRILGPEDLQRYTH